jgi:hypothetical protein
MKFRLFAVLLLLTVIFSSAAPAQQAEPSASNEDRLAYLFLGTFLTVSEAFEEIDDEWIGIRDGLVESFKGIETELSSFGKIEVGTSEAERRALLRTSISEVSKSAQGEHKWQFDLGVDFGKAMLELRPSVHDETRPIDEDLIRRQLGKIDAAMASAPAGFPEQAAKELKAFAEIAKEKDLNSDNVKNRLFASVAAILQAITP